MSSGGYDRDYDDDTKEPGYSKSWDRGSGKSEKEFWGRDDGHWREDTYKDGTTYRTYDDGTVEKRK